MSSAAALAYRTAPLKAQTTQASALDLVLLLTDSLLDELARLRGHLAGRRYEAKAHSLAHCHDMLGGLSHALDYENGGEVADNLDRLYQYFSDRLHHAGVTLELAPVDEVDDLLRLIRQAWAQMRARHE